MVVEREKLNEHLQVLESQRNEMRKELDIFL